MTTLHQLTLQVPQAQAAIFAALFEDDALAVTVQAPPRQALAEISVLYNMPPAADAVTVLLQDAAEQNKWAMPKFIIAALAQEDWLQRVAQATPPRRIGRLLIHGAHDKDKVTTALPRLQIEAATAFGTGEHPSTQMCLMLLQEVLQHRTPRRALDVGCGSGILALALARLAHRRSLAVDCDAESVRLTRENARINGLSHWVTALPGAGYQPSAVRRGRPYDLVFANIFARPLMALAVDLRAHLAPGGHAILAGLLTSQALMVLAAHRMQRLHLVRQIRQGEWSALLLKKGQRR